MNNTDAHAEVYVKRFWPEKPQPIKDMLKLAYKAGENSMRGQAAIAALQGLLSNPECIGSLVVEKGLKPAKERAAEWAVAFANALIDRLNTNG